MNAWKDRENFFYFKFWRFGEERGLRANLLLFNVRQSSKIVGAHSLLSALPAYGEYFLGIHQSSSTNQFIYSIQVTFNLLQPFLHKIYKCRDGWKIALACHNGHRIEFKLRKMFTLTWEVNSKVSKQTILNFQWKNEQKVATISIKSQLYSCKIWHRTFQRLLLPLEQGWANFISKGPKTVIGLLPRSAVYIYFYMN